MSTTTAAFFVHSQVRESDIPRLLRDLQPAMVERIEEMAEKSLSDMTLQEQRQLRYFTPPFEWGTIQNIERADGKCCNLLIIAFPYTAAELHMAMNKKHPRHKRLKARIYNHFIMVLDEMREQGISVVGLGGHFSILLSDREDSRLMRAARERGIILVDGNSQTAAFTAQALEQDLEWSGLSREKALIGIVGATGSVGRQVALILAEKGYKLMLCSRHESDLHDLLKDLKGTHQVTTSKKAVYGLCDLVLSATSETTEWQIPKKLPKPNQRIRDICVPPSINPKIACQRKDILLIHGVFVECPGLNLLFAARFDDPGERTYPCSIQTMDAAMDGATRNQLRSLSAEELLGAYPRAVSLGYKLASPLDKSKRELTPHDYLIPAQYRT